MKNANFGVKISGKKVYDYRIDKMILSGNPALILGQLLIDEYLVDDEVYIDKTEKRKLYIALIKRMADYCDEYVDWSDKGLIL